MKTQTCNRHGYSDSGCSKSATSKVFAVRYGCGSKVWMCNSPKFLVLKLLVFPHAYDIPYGIEILEAVDPHTRMQSKVAGTRLIQGDSCCPDPAGQCQVAASRASNRRAAGRDAQGMKVAAIYPTMPATTTCYIMHYAQKKQIMRVFLIIAIRCHFFNHKNSLQVNMRCICIY
jgi:hypothetical protein